jgi:hypothetical protein
MMNPGSGGAGTGRSISERGNRSDLLDGMAGRETKFCRDVSTLQYYPQDGGAGKPEPLVERHFWLVPIDGEPSK